MGVLVELMEVSLNYCPQNGRNLYRDPYYNRNPNIGPRIDSNLGQSPHEYRDSGYQTNPIIL